MGRSCSQYGVSRQFSEVALQAMEQSEWKGNALEPWNVVEQLVVTAGEMSIRSEHLPKRLFGINDSIAESDAQDVQSDGLSLQQKMDKYESILVNDAFAKLKTSRKVAEYLQISRAKANKLIQKYIINKMAEA